MALHPLVFWLAIASPFLAAMCSFIFPKRVSYIVTSSSLLTLALLVANMGIFLEGKSYELGVFTWWALETSNVSFGIMIDPLSMLMGIIVAFISLVIFLYSLDYMKDDDGASRFWFFFGCFESSMLLLIFSNNLIMMLIGWEGVGMSSLFLISHYYRDPKERWLGGPEGFCPFKKPSFCGIKALLTTGVADVFMLAGIFLLFALYGTFNFLELQHLADTSPVNPPLLLLASVLIIIGPLGKSAQFPFQEWLPEAMAGPTPVSALLHSATMVKAGVYLVARLSIFFSILGGIAPLASSSFFLMAIAMGLVTVIMGSLYGCIAIELKKILAYSTISQLGYMFVALGIAGVSGSPLVGMSAALLHLFSHSIFKAGLFLSAGPVIHGTHTPYITHMGSLRKAMPKAFIAMTLSTLSLAALPPLLGFWSKDAILAAVYPVNVIVGLLLSVAAVLTVFYSFRMIWYTFFGPRKVWEGLHKERPLLVAPPLLLGGLTFVLGFFGPQLDAMFHESLHRWLHYEAGYAPAWWVYALTAAAIILGFASAYAYYPRGGEVIKAISSPLLSLEKRLRARPVDRVYEKVSMGTFWVSAKLYTFEIRLDQWSMVLAGWIIKLAKAMSSFQSGDLNRYLSVAATLLLFLLLLLLLVSSL